MFRAVRRIHLTLLFGTWAGFFTCGLSVAGSTNQYASSLTADETGVTSVEHPQEVPYIRLENSDRSQSAALFVKNGLEAAGAKCTVQMARSDALHPPTSVHSIENCVPYATLLKQSTRLQI
jgi:hypothetical protein